MERHGFVTFWLGMIIFVGAISLLLCVFGSDYFNYFYSSQSASVIMGITSIIICIAAILLLNWRIIGFWIFLITSIVEIFFMMNWGVSVYSSIISGAIGPALLWGILHLKKNNISAWDYLTKDNIEQEIENNIYSNIYGSDNSSKQKKCPFCAEKIKEEAIVCRFCGRDLPKEEAKLFSENEIIDEHPKNKNVEIEQLEKLFESTTDENEKGIIAKKLYDLGKIYYWRFIPRDSK
jgi:hypothetical protein